VSGGLQAVLSGLRADVTGPLLNTVD